MTDKNLAIGDRVQFTEDQHDNGSTGTIDSLCMDTEDGVETPCANVLWDDAHETEMHSLSILMLVPPERAALEVEFRAAVDEVSEMIQSKLNMAATLIAEAEKISEETGVPFSASVSPLGQSYFPASFSKKYGKLGHDFVTDLTGAWTEYWSEGAGWQHSDVC